MSDAVKRNDLLTYENVTRQTGPAMTWQIHAISHIELNEIDKADVFFRKSYQNYIRPPFNVKEKRIFFCILFVISYSIRFCWKLFFYYSKSDILKTFSGLLKR